MGLHLNRPNPLSDRFWNQAFVEENFGLKWPTEPPVDLSFLRPPVAALKEASR